jgi:Fe-S cluster biogenesis protein NfuA
MGHQDDHLKTGYDGATSPAEGVTERASISTEEREARHAALGELIEAMSEAVREDGGELVLIGADYETGVVEVELQGACGSCAISGITLQGGVDRMLKERLEWVTEVRGGVDESIDFETSFAMGRGAYIPRA